MGINSKPPQLGTLAAYCKSLGLFNCLPSLHTPSLSQALTQEFWETGDLAIRLGRRKKGVLGD